MPTREIPRSPHTTRATSRRRPGAAAFALAAALAGTLPAPDPVRAAVPTDFADRLVVTGLDLPVGMAFLPDGRLLVTEQNSTKIRLLVNGALAATDPVVTLTDVATGWERGLLGIVVDPGWPARPYVYVHCDRPGNRIRVSRYTVTGDLAFTGNGALAIDNASRYDLVNDIPDAAGNHNGGTLRFGPDGMLYGSFGDDAVECAAQNPNLLQGVILRLDVSRLPPGPGGPAPRALVAAPGNPFATSPDSNARLVWAYGLRNPFRFHIDAADGALFVADVGEVQREELSRVDAPGLNLGWPQFEGTFPRGSVCPPASPRTPIYEYDRTGFTAAIISAGVYRATSGASRFPASYRGSVFISDYYAGFLRRLTGSGSAWSIAPPVPGQPGALDWGTGFDAVSDWLEGPDGALWYCRQAVAFQPNTGQIRRIEYTAGSPPDTTPALALAVSTFPLPAPGYVNLRYTLTRAARVTIDLHDARGTLIRRLEGPVQSPAGVHDRTWDGRDGTGRDVRPGMYFVRLRAGSAEVTRRVPFVR